MEYYDIFEIAEKHYENEDFIKALEYFEKAFRLNPSNTNANYIACCHIGLGDYVTAENILLDLSKKTHWETIYYNLGRIYILQNKFELAKFFLETALLMNPQNDDCYFYLGVYFEKQKRYAEAIRFYEQAVAKSSCDEDVSMYCNNIGLCYFKTNNPQKAMYYYELALQKNPENTDVFYNKNLIKLKNKGEENVSQ